MTQFHFTPERYVGVMTKEIPRFEDFQDAVASATGGMDARTLLELGTGTGETARRVLALHPRARLIGIDESDQMLGEARRTLPAAELRVGRLQEPLPDDPFDLAFSALTVHHLDAREKRDLFERVRRVLRPGGRFVLGDVVVPERAEEAATPLTPDFDRPDSAADQVEWLRETGFDAEIVWEHADLAVLRADAR
jgi:tRNA (cmo5U34)-methyltransferase